MRLCRLSSVNTAFEASLTAVGRPYGAYRSWFVSRNLKTRYSYVRASAGSVHSHNIAVDIPEPYLTLPRGKPRPKAPPAQYRSTLLPGRNISAPAPSYQEPTCRWIPSGILNTFSSPFQYFPYPLSLEPPEVRMGSHTAPTPYDIAPCRTVLLFHA